MVVTRRGKRTGKLASVDAEKVTPSTTSSRAPKPIKVPETKKYTKAILDCVSVNVAPTNVIPHGITSSSRQSSDQAEQIGDEEHTCSKSLSTKRARKKSVLSSNGDILVAAEVNSEIIQAGDSHDVILNSASSEGNDATEINSPKILNSSENVTNSNNQIVQKNDSLETKDVISSSRPGTPKSSPQRSASTSTVKLETETPAPIDYAALAVQEKYNWQGFCEIDSDPTVINTMLKDLGVKGVKSCYIYNLEPDGIDELRILGHTPIFGFIFLFKYRDIDAEKQDAPCPHHVWYAHQTAPNSCASVALLNIIMNLSDLDIGENLRSFKDFTLELSPLHRGEQITHFEFLKRIHNSFAKGVKMLEVDHNLQQKYNKANTKTAIRKRKRNDDQNGSHPIDDNAVTVEYDDEAGHHYIAYVPVKNEIWKLDGMDRHPQKLCKLVSSWFRVLYIPDIPKKPGSLSAEKHDWVAITLDAIKTVMLANKEASDRGEFTLLALTRDPLLVLHQCLAQIIKALITLEDRLDSIGPDWREFLDESEREDMKLYTTPVEAFDISAQTIEEAEVDEDLEEKMKDASLAELMRLREVAVSSWKATRDNIIGCHDAEEREAKRAEELRFDYGPAIRAWFRALAEKDGVLEQIITDITN